MHLDIINKDTPDYLTHVDKRELTMLVHMLEDLKHSATESSKQTYGYHDDHAQWNHDALAEYKAGALAKRMTEKGYTFFLLHDDNGELVALASGNAGEDKTQLRLLNITVGREHRKRGHLDELLKRVSDFAAEHDYESIVIPLSVHAKANVGLYQHIAEKIGIEFPEDLQGSKGVRNHPDDDGSVELVLTPKRFLTLQPHIDQAARNASAWQELQ